MDQQTKNVAATSETITSAMDGISLHPDRHDEMIVDNEGDEATEVIATFSKSLNDTPKIFIPCIFKAKLLNEGKTQSKRAPRPLFMGPKQKIRRSRGGRKNTNSSANNRDTNANQIASVDDKNANKSAPVDDKKANQNTPVDAKNANDSAPVNDQSAPVEDGRDTHNPVNKLCDWATMITKNGDGRKSADQKQAANAHKNPKRARSAQTRPNATESSVPNARKKQRTFADVVANDLKLQIINKTDGITNAQLSLIETSLMNELDKYMETLPPSAPTFHAPSFHNGIMKLICADSFSAEWIKEVIQSMPPPWEGAALEINACEPPNAKSMANVNQKRQGNIPRRPTVRFFIPNGVKKPTFEEVAKKLQFQNKPLNTEGWIAWKASDIEFIKAKMSRLFYCFSKIRFTLPKEPKGKSSQEENVEENVNSKDNQ